MYFDSAYIAKVYVNEPDSALVRNLVRHSSEVFSSSLALVEVTSVFQRYVREGRLTVTQGRELLDRLRDHISMAMWILIPITDALLNDTARLIQGLPAEVPIRTGDALHLATAINRGETEIWTNDRHLLRAAGHVGLKARTVSFASL